MFIEFFRGTKEERAIFHSRDQLRSRTNLRAGARERLVGLELEAKSISRKLRLRMAGTAGVALVVIAMGIAVWPSLNPSQGFESRTPSAVTATISAYPLRDKLMDWDSKITTGTVNFLTIAPEIAKLASQTLCADIKCDPSYENPPLDLQNNREFKRTIYLDDPCSTVNPDDDSPAQGYAFSRPLSGTIFFNADLLQYSNLLQRIKLKNTATQFFQIFLFS